MSEETMESENAAFWLPSHFLTDDDFLPVSDHHHLPPKFDLFSTTFDPFAPQKENHKYDDEFLTDLTRQLACSSLNHSSDQKSWNLSTSPQSTLTGLANRSGLSSNGSPNGGSPPLTPPGAKKDASWDLLYEAATEVARLKMAAHHHRHHYINSSYNYSCNTDPVKRHGSGDALWGHHQNTQRRTCGGFNAIHHFAWAHRHNLNHRMGPLFIGSGKPVKKQSTGTGVFIPRRFGAHPEPRKNAPVTVSGGVVGAVSVDHQHINNGLFINSTRFAPNYDILTARRNAIMNQQSSIRQEMPVTMVGEHARLPADWTY